MAFDVRRTQPKLNQLNELGQAPETKIRRRPSVAWSA